MKQFTLDEYWKNPDRKILTRGGKNARVICSNRVMACNDFRPIVALIEQKGNADLVKLYYSNGVCYSNDLPDENDLFFAPEKHQGWVIINRDSKGDPYVMTQIYDSKEDAERDTEEEDNIGVCKIEWGE